MKLRVYYEDTDVGGVVYHSNYLNFCERARSELFFSQGKSPILEGGHFVASSLEAKFAKPAKFGDLLEVKTELDVLKNASFSLIQTIYRGEELLFKMKINLVYLDAEFKVQRFDTQTKALLQTLLP